MIRHDYGSQLRIKVLAKELSCRPLFAAAVVECVYGLARGIARSGDLSATWPVIEYDLTSELPGLSPDTLLPALQAAGIIGEDMSVVDWPLFCGDYIHSALARAQELFADGEFPKPRSLTGAARRAYDGWTSGICPPNVRRTPEGEREGEREGEDETENECRKNDDDTTRARKPSPESKRPAPGAILEADFRPIVSSSSCANRSDCEVAL